MSGCRGTLSSCVQNLRTLMELVDRLELQLNRIYPQILTRRPRGWLKRASFVPMLSVCIWKRDHSEIPAWMNHQHS
ncbi:hypothetical protein DPEC_G00004280 [Dallia pectoralis]|uniref:Uncharacterized protein n=1 Tax=Dallia pectoralis TaxID=75939 RepID=A0ACC2HJM2_DALPE|nr:hypothetical protein DPEC_G00004280 [Dallia pectoralis]